MSVVFTGGGTIGPITSLVPIIKELKNANLTIHFIAPTKSQGKELIDELGVSWNEIPAAKFSRYATLSWFFIPFQLFGGFFRGLQLLNKFKPRVVVTSGSYVSPPVVWAAWLLRISVIIIQLDIQPGLANKLSQIGKTKQFFSYKGKTSQGENVIGPLIRRHHVNEKNVYIPPGFETSLPTIFITGGGTGAIQLNKIIWDALPALTNRANIVHATGRGKENNSYSYKRYLQVPFLDADNYYYWLQNASIVIGRSGMGFFSDVIAYRKPTITIPMFGTHQEANAKYFFEKKAVLMPKNEQSLTEEWLLSVIDELFTDTKKLFALKEAIGSFEQSGTVQNIVSTIQQLHGKKD